MLTLNDITEYTNSHYPVPTLRTWTPSEYDMKYHFNTPRRLKKLEKVKQEEDQKLRIIYDKEVNKRNSVFDVLNDIATMPAAIGDLFYSTLKWQVEDGIMARQKFREIESKFKAKYDYKPEGAAHSWYTPFSMCDQVIRYYKKNYTTSVWEINEQNLKALNSNCSYWDTVDVNDYIEIAQEYQECKHAAVNSLGPSETLLWGSSKLKDIIDTMRKLMEGNPESCETEPNWGVGGYFNAILVRGNRRVSFKSFVAGGWNIQRRHIRARMTLLKEIQ